MWFPIDHRLFTEWQDLGRPPAALYQAIFIRTTTDTKLCVTTQLVHQEYPRAVKISVAQFASIALERHHVQPPRNYTILYYAVTGSRPSSWSRLKACCVRTSCLVVSGLRIFNSSMARSP